MLIMTTVLTDTSVLTISVSQQSVWRTQSVRALIRSVMRTTTTASTVGPETAKHLSAAVQVLLLFILFVLRLKCNYQGAMTVI